MLSNLKPNSLTEDFFKSNKKKEQQKTNDLTTLTMQPKAYTKWTIMTEKTKKNFKSVANEFYIAVECVTFKTENV